VIIGQGRGARAHFSRPQASCSSYGKLTRESRIITAEEQIILSSDCADGRVNADL
jgi:hypothetical protein